MTRVFIYSQADEEFRMGLFDFNWYKKKTEVAVAAPRAVQRPEGPPAYVNCGLGIEFTGAFIVGMTLTELLEWLQINTSYNTFMEGGEEHEWLPKRLREADPEGIDLNYVIQPFDIILLGDDNLLPSPEQEAMLNERKKMQQATA